MTHERLPNLDEWDELGPAELVPTAPLPDVPIGDLQPGAELEAMLRHDREQRDRGGE